MKTHIQLYRARRDHARLSQLVQMEQAGPRPDAIRLAQLKKKRLEAKDRIARFEALTADGPQPAFA